MTRDSVLAKLRAHEGELRRMGVERLSLFGSVARGEARPDSDVDLAAQLDHSRRLGLFDYVRISQRLSELLGVHVDLLSEPARNPRLQASVEEDRVHVF